MGERRGATAAVVAVLVAVVLAPAGAAWGADAEVGDPVRISNVPDVTRTFEGPTAAIDPTDPTRVFVAVASLQDDTCPLFRSLDGGRTFGALDGPDFGSFTDCGFNKAGLPKNMRMRLAFDPEGVLYWAVAVAEPAAMGGRSIVLARSPDQGDTWSTTTVTRAPAVATPEEAVGNFVPDVFVSPFGAPPRTVWVSWRRSFTSAADRTTEGWAAVSTDGGRSFGPEVRGLVANPGFDAPRVVVDGRGTAYWFQRERPDRAAEGEPPNPSPLLMATSRDGGRTWREGDVGVSHVVMEEPLVGVSPDGDTVYLVWADASNGDLDVFLSRTTDGGETWSERVRINDDEVGNRKTQKWPRMSIAPGGRIDVVWYDYRHQAADTPEDDLEFYLGDANDVYLATSTDEGRSFTNVRVTDTSIDRTLGTYNTQYFVEVPPAVGSADEAAFVAWSDTRLANLDTQAQDLFGTAIALTDEGPTPGELAAIVVAAVLIVVGVGFLVAGLVRRGRTGEAAAPG